ncbi:MAG: hypothetical protein JWM57_3442 [Phycisphaerales bacterium]|nr:hypothetical protein [Phycisphaerales bacterium]
MIARMADVDFTGPEGPPKRCKVCAYVLDHLGIVGQCPECGQPFNLADPMTYTNKPPFLWWTFWMPGLLTAFAIGVALYLLLIPLMGYGWATTVAVPTAAGAILGYRVQMQWAVLVLLSLIVASGMAATLLMMSVTGGLCTLILGTLAVLPAFCGVCVGVLLRTHLKGTKFTQRLHLPMLALLPVLLALIEGRHSQMAVVTTSTVATLNAPPDRAWQSIQFYEQVKHRPPWLLYVSPSLRPLYTFGQSGHVGDRKTCIYERGRLVKEITEVVPGKRLAFKVVEQTEIENDGVRLIDGSFELTPTADGRGTVVTLTTRYEPKLAPRFAYLPAENMAVHTLHGHVLRGMKEDAEAAPAGHK